MDKLLLKRWSVLGIAGVALLALGALLSMGISAKVGAHGGDTTLGHACAESTALFLNIVITPGLVPAGDLDCTTLGPGWFNYDTGDISGVGVAAGSGLTGGAGSGVATLGTDSAVLQQRVAGTCPVGQAIRVVAGTGAVTCQVAGGIGGAGTANMIAKFTGASTTGNSVIAESAGNVGIGTTSPDNALHIKGSGIDGITLERSSTEQDTQIKFQNEIGDDKWWISFDGDLPQDLFLFPVASEQDLILQADEEGTIFGNVGIGTNNPSQKLHVNGNVVANGFGSPSSRRFKTNIQPVDGALDKVQQLQGVTYERKADGKHDIGLIAEEVGEVLPQIVTYEENGEDAISIDYARLVPLLIEAIKEQQAQIGTLQRQNNDLEARTSTLEGADQVR